MAQLVRGTHYCSIRRSGNRVRRFPSRLGRHGSLSRVCHPGRQRVPGVLATSICLVLRTPGGRIHPARRDSPGRKQTARSWHSRSPHWGSGSLIVSRPPGLRLHPKSHSLQACSAGPENKKRAGRLYADTHPVWGMKVPHARRPARLFRFRRQRAPRSSRPVRASRSSSSADRQPVRAWMPLAKDLKPDPHQTVAGLRRDTTQKVATPPPARECCGRTRPRP